MTLEHVSSCVSTREKHHCIYFHDPFLPTKTTCIGQKCNQYLISYPLEKWTHAQWLSSFSPQSYRLEAMWPTKQLGLSRIVSYIKKAIYKCNSRGFCLQSTGLTWWKGTKCNVQKKAKDTAKGPKRKLITNKGRHKERNKTW